MIFPVPAFNATQIANLFMQGRRDYSANASWFRERFLFNHRPRGSKQLFSHAKGQSANHNSFRVQKINQDRQNLSPPLRGGQARECRVCYVDSADVMRLTAQCYFPQLAFHAFIGEPPGQSPS
jgi:hypothetical protein